MAPSPLYNKLHSLASAHANPTSLDHLLSIRAPDAIHAWGHAYLVSRNPKLGDRMNNDAFEAHLLSTGPHLTGGDSKTHDIIIDENQRKAVIHMSYFLTPMGSDETVEQNLIWVLKFTEEADVEKVLVKESVEFIDAAASARLGSVITRLHGELGDDVRGGITLKES